MLGNAFGWPHLLIILAVVLLLFGAAKLPALAKSMGQSARVFKGEMKAMKAEDTDVKAAADAETQQLSGDSPSTQAANTAVADTDTSSRTS